VACSSDPAARAAGGPGGIGAPGGVGVLVCEARERRGFESPGAAPVSSACERDVGRFAITYFSDDQDDSATHTGRREISQDQRGNPQLRR
jgi:hypothetical protein